MSAVQLSSGSMMLTTESILRMCLSVVDSLMLPPSRCSVRLSAAVALD